MNTITQKQCTKCGEIKPVTEFTKHKLGKNGLRSRCRSCEKVYAEANKERASEQGKQRYRMNCKEINERHKAWYAANKEKFGQYSKEWYAENAEAHREKTLKRRYDITPSKLKNILEQQGGRCKICGTDKPEGRGFVVDHDHGSGIIRGVLCFKCNIGLGNFKDNILVMENAIEYLLHAFERRLK